MNHAALVAPTGSCLVARTIFRPAGGMRLVDSIMLVSTALALIALIGSALT